MAVAGGCDWLALARKASKKSESKLRTCVGKDMCDSFLPGSDDWGHKDATPNTGIFKRPETQTRMAPNANRMPPFQQPVPIGRSNGSVKITRVGGPYGSLVRRVRMG